MVRLSESSDVNLSNGFFRVVVQRNCDKSCLKAFLNDIGSLKFTIGFIESTLETDRFETDAVRVSVRSIKGSSWA